ncbi:MAG: hypothetical protein J5809_08055 [Selenomonadaceae bacterium]|nr:hypothetical protein [Selenomonadaceae bacterium]
MAYKTFVFFNCDADKSEASMNIFYNNALYGNSLVSRGNLLNKVMAELDAGRIKIADADIKKVQSLIIKGDPVAASEFMQYGAIREFEIQ